MNTRLDIATRIACVVSWTGCSLNLDVPPVAICTATQCFDGSILQDASNGIEDAAQVDADGGGTSSEDRRSGTCSKGEECESCVVYVDIRSECSEGCGASWSRAFTRVQDGIEAAKLLAPCDVWVASGTYLPSLGEGREASVFMRSGVSMYGGFVGREETLDERDAMRHPAVLSGDLGVPGDSSDNAYHVVIGANDALLDGFTITGGQADGRQQDLSASYDDNSYPNSSGAGMQNVGVAPSVVNCLFTHNWAQDSGGAVENRAGNPVFLGTSFVENVSGYGGGAMNNAYSSPTVWSCTFLRNSADGGGAMNNYSGSPNVQDSLFRGNTASAGGAIYNVWATPVFSASQFVENTARVGGAMYTNYTGVIQLDGCAFVGNSSVDNGGAINTSLSPTRVSNCTFVENTTESVGGAISVEGQDSWLSIVHSTFTLNTALLGGGAVYFYTPDSQNMSITNSILWANGAKPILAQWKTPSIRYSDVQGGCHTQADGGCTSDETGNMDADPLFADSPVPSDAGVDTDFDLGLQRVSPCLNAADPNSATRTDQRGHVRIDGPDLGAIESY